MAIIECRASQAEPNMSCLAGKGGKLEATGGWTAGLLKEAYDLTKKSVSSETRKRYGGIGNIFKDSAKDIVNNWKGLHYGFAGFLGYFLFPPHMFGVLGCVFFNKY